MAICRNGFSLWVGPKPHRSSAYSLQVSAVSVLNSIQAYASLYATQRIYSVRQNAKGKTGPSQITPVAARLFGTWTLVSSMVRLYAAYHISNPQIYQMAFSTYAIAFFHFYSEWLLFGTAKWGFPLAGPALISVGTMTWMWLQWGYYVG
jgi:hypothetical protein